MEASGAGWQILLMELLLVVVVVAAAAVTVALVVLVAAAGGEADTASACLRWSTTSPTTYDASAVFQVPPVITDALCGTADKKTMSVAGDRCEKSSLRHHVTTMTRRAQ